MKYFSWFIIAVVAAAVVAGFFIVGTPKEERMRRFDGERVGQLQQLQSEIISFWQAKERLPTNLSELADPTRGVVIPKDPETGTAYEYAVKAADTFELCASFALPSIEDGVAFGKPIAPRFIPGGAPYPISDFYGPDAWKHGAGRVCFEREIDKDFFPPVEKPTRKVD